MALDQPGEPPGMKGAVSGERGVAAYLKAEEGGGWVADVAWVADGGLLVVVRSGAEGLISASPNAPYYYYQSFSLSLPSKFRFPRYY